jgi:hypothetical protein
VRVNERNERGMVRGRDGAEGEREEERLCGRDSGMKRCIFKM